MKNLLLSLATLLCFCCFNVVTAQGCVTLTLNDSYGDGWNNAYIMFDGVNYAGSGSSSTFDLCDVDWTSCVSATWTSGAYDYECSWIVADADGNEMFSGVAGDAELCPAVTCDDTEVTYASTDSWAGENGFTITDCDGNVLASMSAGAGFDDCLALPDNYILTMTDSYGDGGGSVSIGDATYTLDSGSEMVL